MLLKSIMKLHYKPHKFRYNYAIPSYNTQEMGWRSLAPVFHSQVLQFSQKNKKKYTLIKTSLSFFFENCFPFYLSQLQLKFKYTFKSSMNSEFCWDSQFHAGSNKLWEIPPRKLLKSTQNFQMNLRITLAWKKSLSVLLKNSVLNLTLAWLIIQYCWSVGASYLK